MSDPLVTALEETALRIASIAATLVSMAMIWDEREQINRDKSERGGE
jgi:hypothetical protein